MPVDLVKPALEGLRATFGGAVREAAILSTCNRTELYCAAEGQVASICRPGWLSTTGWKPMTLRPHLYRHQHDDAVRHAFRVASGLDSMVLGEPQILGQMKDAVRAANEAGALGTLLHQLFQRTFSVAKEVRSQTAIGAHSVSMAAAAVRLAERVFGQLEDVRTLFIGAGEMIELCATHFAAQRPRSMVVANRTIERAETLAGRFSAQTMKLADLTERLAEFDVIVSCTASSCPSWGWAWSNAPRASAASPHGDDRPGGAARYRARSGPPGRRWHLYSVDDLGPAGAKRAPTLAQRGAIIETRASFMRWMRSREVVPVITTIRPPTQGRRARRAPLARG